MLTGNKLIKTKLYEQNAESSPLVIMWECNTWLAIRQSKNSLKCVKENSISVFFYIKYPACNKIMSIHIETKPTILAWKTK